MNVKIKCGERGSNTRPSDLQSDALPTELSPLYEFTNALSLEYMYYMHTHTLSLNMNVKIKCGERGSNMRPSDLQSDALPTELSPLDEFTNALSLYI
ncbi:hypothetical protein LINPERPRIM_LOCUS3074 [Linum perenne]